MGFPTSIHDIQPYIELHVSSWASVYKAYQPSLDRNVLLKVLNPVLSSDKRNADWFRAEAQLTAKIKHPNIVSIYSFGESEDGIYFISEFVEGVTLQEVMERGNIPLDLSVYIFEQIVLGLEAAHDKGVLHRDLKPDNVLISFDGEIKLTDFGFATLLADESDQNEIRGTVGYMAPELLFEGRSDKASDLFAAGAVLYRLIGGRSPFPAEDLDSYMAIVRKHDPIPYIESNPLLPEELIDLCQRLLANKPEDRPPDAASVLKLVRIFQQKQGWSLTRESLSEWLEDPDAYDSHEKGRTQNAKQLQGKPVAYRKNPFGARGWQIALAVIVIALAYVIWTNVKNSEEASVATIPESVSEAIQMPPAAQQTGGEASKPNKVESPSVDNDLSPPVAHDSADTDADSTAKSVAETTSVQSDSNRSGTESSASGYLTILCLPSCTIEVEEENRGAAPPVLTLALPVGSHQIKLSHPRFPEFKTDINIEEGRHDTLNVSLWSTVGTLDLVVIPWGEVYIDSTSYGIFPPATPVVIYPGEHTLRVEHPLLGRREISFTVAAGERLERTVNLNESDSDS